MEMFREHVSGLAQSALDRLECALVQVRRVEDGTADCVDCLVFDGPRTAEDVTARFEREGNDDRRVPVVPFVVDWTETDLLEAVPSSDLVPLSRVPRRHDAYCR